MFDYFGQSRGARRFQVEGILTFDSHSDLAMLAVLNAQERSAEGWENLVQSADARFKLSRIIQPPLANQGLIEIVWCGT